MTKMPANDEPVDRGQLVITRGPNDDVVLAFAEPIKVVGFNVPQALVVAIGIMEMCLQIMTQPIDHGDLPN